MKDSAHHPDFSLDPFSAIRVGEHAADHGRAGHDPRRAIVRNLDVVRSHLDDAINSCAERESRGDLVEIDERWRSTPHRLTQIDSLLRLKAHLDRFEARLLTTYFPREGHGPSVPLRKLDLAMIERSGAMARRFEEPSNHHDLQADLESGFGEIERLLDAHNQIFSDAGRPHAEPPIDRAGGLPAVEPSPTAPAEGDPPGRLGSASCTIDEYREVLLRVDRHIVNAAGDPPLQGFWRGVAQRYREEIERLSRAAGAARFSLSAIDS